MAIRVLALDDDNHHSMFATEYGNNYEDARSFLEVLSKPHNEIYDIRGFCLIEHDGPAAELDESTVDHLFSYVSGYARQPEGYTFQEAFDILWASSEKEWRL